MLVGQKHHCTFCGINGAAMRFRSKSPERVARELAELAERYQVFNFESEDNIVDNEYLTTLFPRLVDSGNDYKLFYEIKSNLTRQQLKRLRQAGVVELQPGIESLNTHVLQLMKKGTTGIQNVNTLRWATYYDIAIGWNMLWGFAGETEEDFTQIVKRAYSPSRTYPIMLHQAEKAGVIPQHTLAVLRGYLKDDAPDAKRNDAVKLLHEVKQLAATL